MFNAYNIPQIIYPSLLVRKQILEFVQISKTHTKAASIMLRTVISVSIGQMYLSTNWIFLNGIKVQKYKKVFIRETFAEIQQTNRVKKFFVVQCQAAKQLRERMQFLDVPRCKPSCAKYHPQTNLTRFLDGRRNKMEDIL